MSSSNTQPFSGKNFLLCFGILFSFLTSGALSAQTQDVTDPVISFCGNDFQVSCLASVPACNPNDAIATDDSGIAPNLTCEQGPLVGGECGGTITNIYTASDDAGNSSTCEQVITIMDTEAPLFLFVPADAVVSCDAIVFGDVIAEDNCILSEVTFSDVTSGNTCNSEITRTWLASDACGNTATATQTLTLIDTTAPEFSDCPADVQYQCDGDAPGVPSITATDNCSGSVDVYAFETNMSDPASSVCNLETPGSAADGVQYWAVTLPGLPGGINPNFIWDANGATMQQSGDELLITGTVVNVIDPSYSFFVHFQAEAKVDWAGWNSQLTTTNPFTNRIYKDTHGHAAAGGGLWTTWDFYEVDITSSFLEGQGALTGSHLAMGHAPTNYLFGTQVGEAANDKTPGFGLSSWFYVEGTILCEDYIGQGDISSNADCSNPTTDCAYTILRQWTTTDSAGNIASCEQVVTVADTEGPIFSSLPADMTVECDAVPAAEVLTATDNCDDNVSVSYSDVTNGAGCEYTIVRTWTVVDDCNNSSMHMQTLTVVDTTAPEFIPSTVPADVTVECDAIPAAGDPNTTDNCQSPVSIELFESEAGDDCEKEITRTWVINDGCGNTNSVSQVITVVDTTAPEFIASTVPTDMTIECGDAIPDVQFPNTTDNCSMDVSISMDETSVGDNCETIITRTFTINDGCDNTNSVAQTITVIDTTAPEFIPSTLPADVTVECGNVPAVADPNTTDNCSMSVSLSIEETSTPGACPQEETIVRVFTINDGCGNSNAYTQTINVVDTTAPVIVLPAETVVDISCDEYVCGYENGLALLAGQLSPTEAAQFIACTQGLFAQYDILPLDVTDNCDDVQWEATSFIPVVHPTCTDFEGSSNVKTSFICWFNATDACGNAADSVYTVLNIVDNTAPVITGVPADATMECDNVDRNDNVMATDDCGSVPLDYAEYITDMECTGTYTLTRVWSAIDACGNSAEATQVITVVDTTAPEFIPGTVPADVTVECGNIPEVVYPNTVDNCSDLVTIELEEAIVDGDCPQEMVITRTWTINDGCDNTNTVTQVITVVDTTAPEFGPLEPFITVECDGIPAPADVIVTDNCGTATLSIADFPVSGGCQGAIERIYTAEDECGNTAQYTQIINVIDTTAPVLVGVPADLTISCEETVPAFTVTATDNCDDVTVDMTSETLDACGNTYTTTYTFSVEDICGNSSVATYTLTVVDTTAPVIELPAETVVDITCEEYVCGYDNGLALLAGQLSPVEAAQFIACTQGLFAQYDILPLGVTDNCDDVMWEPTSFIPVVHPTCTEFEGSSNVKVSFICWFNATDACGNAADSVYTVLNIVDNTAPVLSSLPANMTVECDAIPAAELLTATDDCDISIPVIYSEMGVVDGCYSTIERMWTATDACGNETVHVQTLTVVDTTAPEFIPSTIPQDITVECDAIPAIADPNTTDNCQSPVSLTITEEEVPGNCPNEMTIIRTFTINDMCGNSNAVSQTITVVDTTAPEFGAIEPFITVECDNIPTATTVPATDNCGPATVTVLDAGFSGGCQGAFERLYTATDACGNTAEFTQIINVIDTTAPVIAGVPADMSIECGSAEPTPVVTATDNCGLVDPVMSSSTTQLCGDTYATTYTYTATDDCGNSSVASYTLTVVDTTAPSIVSAADMTIECGLPVPAPSATAEDSCGDATWTVAETFAADCGATGVYTRIYTATDDCGNTATDMQTITIVDTTAPVLDAAPADLTVECDAIPAAATLSATDICSDASVTPSEQVVGAGCEYAIVRTWTASDDCGNSSVVMQTITVVDTTAPQFIPSTVPADITVECDAVPTPADPNTTDNCQSPVSSTLTEVETPGQCDGEKVITRTWVINDMCGNSNSVTQTITVIDTTAPEFDMLPADETYTCGDVIPAAPMMTADDNCSQSVSITLDEVTVGNTNPNLDCGLTQGAPSPALNNTTPWSMFLEMGGVREYFELDGAASFQELPIGGGLLEGHITGTVRHNDPAVNGAFMLDIYLVQKTDFAGWTSQLTLGNPSTNRVAKTFNGVAQPGDELDWDYWLIDASRSQLVGIDAYAGDILSLEHAPTNLYYAVEVGMNANNYSQGFGLGGWFRFSGTIAGVAANGQGDIAFTADCPPCEYTVTRTWTATDDCGNSTVTSQLITVNAPGNIAPGQYLEPVSAAEQFGFVTAYPNPTGETSTLVYRVAQDAQVTIEVLTGGGKAINTLYNGQALSGADNYAQFDGKALENGMYVVKLTTTDGVFHQKILLTK